MTDRGYTFDWHSLRDENSGTDEGFLKWMLVNLVTFTHEPNDLDRANEKNLLERLSDTSDGFTNVTLTIQANGIDLNVEHFVTSVRRNMEWWAKKVAVEEIRRHTDVTELFDVAESFRVAMRTESRRVAHALGIRLNEDGDAL